MNRMEGSICNIQVLLRAAEFLERREREAEHGYASLLPPSPTLSYKISKQKSRKISAGGNRSVHNELEKNRRAQLRQCLEQLKKQVPLASDSMRNTTLNLLRRAQLHIKSQRATVEGRKGHMWIWSRGLQTPALKKKLQEQDARAEQLKGRLRWEQRELQVRLEQLQRGAERMRNDSLGSTMSSERSDSDREDVEVDVESIVFDCMDSEEVHIACSAADHCYSTLDKAWL
ncbi:max dimerization protein 3 isoform X1 [Phyllopteryx taeniolatus]|uniref:max dimerization protein 3 isoform X1 n=1 Tax=Phyllopteryx taeniolatus TaxID=161469 RepID=UPI002AD5A935|nr:max dimerization protein 3 isoform X1 [Phyllopteryx taeniolatus]